MRARPDFGRTLEANPISRPASHLPGARFFPNEPGVLYRVPSVVAYLCVLAGGVLGALARFGVQEAFRKWTALPGWGAIFVVNALGSLAIGFFVAWLQGVQTDLRLETLSPLRLYTETQNAKHGIELLAVGFCGSFTTFSTFSLDNHFLFQAERGRMAFNMIGSVLLCFALAAAGWSLGLAVAG